VVFANNIVVASKDADKIKFFMFFVFTMLD
jgi:hypothetical protein